MMKTPKTFHHFLKTFVHRRVFLFILTGTAVVFLTFLTNNNAFEIVISGVASVFIGIGVNNFTSFETHVKDEQKLKTKIGHALKVMEITKLKIRKIHRQLNKENASKIKDELAELEQVISLSIELIKEEDSLD